MSESSGSGPSTTLSNRKTRNFVAGTLLAAVSLTLAYCYSLERPFLDRFDEYQVQDSLFDQRTGKVVELGRLYNFSSEADEVGVFDVASTTRRTIDLHRPIFSISSPSPVPEQIAFDGQCYFVRTELKQDWTNIRGTWVDPRTKQSLCFYLLTPSGQHISKWPPLPEQ